VRLQKDAELVTMTCSVLGHRLKIEEGILCAFAIAKYYLDPTLTPGGLTPKGTSVYVQEQQSDAEEHEKWLASSCAMRSAWCRSPCGGTWPRHILTKFSSGWQKRRMASSRR